MIKNTDSSVYAAGLLVLLASIQLGCATDPNQAGPSGVQNVPEPNIVLPGTTALTEWLRIRQRLFSTDTGPANEISEDTLLALIQRAAVLEGKQEFMMARLCFSNDISLDTVRRMSQSQECLIEIDGFLGALQEHIQLEATRLARGLASQGQGLMEQLANLSRLDAMTLCEIQSLIKVGKILMFYQRWPNLYRYIESQFDNRKEFCANVFVSVVSNEVVRLKAASKPFFGLLERIQDRIGTNHNQRPPPFVSIPDFSEDSLYQAIASEIKVLSRYIVGSVADLQVQRVVVGELRRICGLSRQNNVVRYYNQILQLLDQLTPITIIYLSTSMRHLLIFEICNKLSDDNFSAQRVQDVIDHMNQNEAQTVLPGGASHELSQEQTRASMLNIDLNLEPVQASDQQVDTIPLPGSPRVESEELFYATLARAVVENYQQDAGVGPSGLRNSDRGH